MMTLRDLFEVFWTITEATITARDADGKFLHKWIFGDDILKSRFMDADIDAGKLTIVNEKINHHGEPSRGGAEIGWGVKTKLFPNDILDAPITHMTPTSYGNHHGILADIEMQPLTIMALLPKGDA